MQLNFITLMARGDWPAALPRLAPVSRGPRPSVGPMSVTVRNRSSKFLRWSGNSQSGNILQSIDTWRRLGELQWTPNGAHRQRNNTRRALCLDRPPAWLRACVRACVRACADLVTVFTVCRSSELDWPTTETINRKLGASARTVGGRWRQQYDGWNACAAVRHRRLTVRQRRTGTADPPRCKLWHIEAAYDERRRRSNEDTARLKVVSAGNSGCRAGSRRSGAGDRSINPQRRVRSPSNNLASWRTSRVPSIPPSPILRNMTIAHQKTRLAPFAAGRIIN